MTLAMLKKLVCILIFSFATLAEKNPDPVVDDWHGVLQIPTGAITLIVSITQDDEGNLGAHMESPDQAPGQKIPISDISVVDDHLSIAIAIIGASIEADWDDEHQHWTGTFSQGIDLPIVLERGLPAKKPIIEGLDGDWNATLNRNGVDLRLILHINTTDDGTKVTLDSPDTMAMGVMVTNLTKDGDSIGYEIAAVSGVFIGTLIDADTFSGTWTLPGQDDVSITFVRAAEIDVPIARNRPQVPTEPYGYRVEEVTFANPDADDVTLAGTLTVPEGDGPFPAAILISGSGPQDRNETVFGHQPFLVLSDHLTKHGIAVLRYDDRGVARSTGNYPNATSADFATDANAAFEYLSARDEIDHASIGFIGHSEGGLIAPIAMKENNDIAFLVMLAGPGTSSMQLMRSQRRLISLSQGESEEDIAKREPLINTISQTVADSSSVEDAKTRLRALLTPQALETLGVSESQIDFIIAQNTSPWLRYFLNYDPAEYLPTITSPILALNGELDSQVPAEENLAGIRTLLQHHDDVTVRNLEGLNHLFQHAKTGALGEYNDIEETFSPEAMTIISGWINERFGNDG